MKVRNRLASTKRTAIVGKSLDALDGRGSGPGFVQWTATHIHRSGATGEGVWKQRCDYDARPLVKKRVDHYGDGFWKLDVVQLDIGLAQEDTFPVRVKVEPERFLFLELGEGQEKEEANGKGNDPREVVPSLHLNCRFPARGGS
jgi:hypothetical protein